MSYKNKYLDSILRLLNEKKALAYAEFNNSDLNTPEKYDEIKRWFSLIELTITKQPPSFFVKEITIYETIQKNIARVEYEYYEKAEHRKKPSIKIISELF